MAGFPTYILMSILEKEKVLNDEKENTEPVTTDNENTTANKKAYGHILQSVKRCCLYVDIVSILLSLIIPVAGLVMIYICLSPVAFTEHKAVNDIFYIVKEISRVDTMCMSMAAVISLLTFMTYIIFNKLYHKYMFVSECDELLEKDAVTLKDKIQKARNELKTTVYKAIFLDVFTILIIVANHLVNAG